MSKKHKADARHIADTLEQARKDAAKRDPDVESFVELSRRSGVKVNTIQNWFQAKCVPRITDLARVAAVLSVPIESFVPNKSRSVFTRLSVEDLVERLDDDARADLKESIRSIVQTAMTTDQPTVVVAAFRKQIETCADLCRRLH